MAPQYEIKFGGFVIHRVMTSIFSYYVLYINPVPGYEYAYQKPSIDKFIKENVFDRLTYNDLDNIGLGEHNTIYIRTMVVIGDEELFSRIGIEEPIFRETSTIKTDNLKHEDILNYEIIYLNKEFEVISDY